MKTKNLIILGSILVIIIGIIFVTEKLDSKKSLSDASSSFLTGFTPGKCSAFSITDKDGSVTIRKKGDRWMVTTVSKTKEDQEKTVNPLDSNAEKGVFEPSIQEEYPADSASVQTALEKISSMKMDDLISQNPEKQELFEVDTAKGTRLEIWDSKNKSLGVFFVGKSGPDWNSHYVRSLGSKDVYSVGGSIKYSFFTEEARWRDKTIIRFDPTFAKKIVLAKKGNASLTIEKSVDTAGTALWTIIKPEKAKAEKTIVDNLVKALSDLKTTEWEHDKSLDNAVMGLDNPYLSISVELENGDVKNVFVGNKQKEGSKYWVRTEGKDCVFLAYESAFSDIDKNLMDIKEKITEEEKPQDSAGKQPTPPFKSKKKSS